MDSRRVAGRGSPGIWSAGIDSTEAVVASVVFKSRNDNERDLTVPAEVERDPKAREVLRAWVANGGLVCSLRPETWDRASSWGIVLADVARHVANAVQELKGDDPAVTTSSIRAVFNAELADPTDEPSGHLEECL